MKRISGAAVPLIFISYRRADSAAAAGRLYDRLILAFGENCVFKDVDAIPAGANYRYTLESAVTSCDVMLVVIGKEWLAADSAGKRRLDEPNDFVRIEVESGLNRDDVLVIPVLVNDAVMPGPDDLPESLRELHYRSAAVVRNDPDFNRDMARLIATIQYQFAAEGDATFVTPIGLDTIPHAPVRQSKAQRHLPWTGILAGVLLVITIVAIISLARKVQQAQVAPTQTFQAAASQQAFMAELAATALQNVLNATATAVHTTPGAPASPTAEATTG